MIQAEITKVYRFGAVEYDLGKRTYLMGILNVTPDSFSDGGKYSDPEAAYEHALHMADAGADFIDVGGESTRPGSEPVSSDEEKQRVVPVIERLAKTLSIPISIDTYKSDVALEALNAGAVIVNEISGLRFDNKMAHVAAQKNAAVVLMHIKGMPKTMQQDVSYENVIEEICLYLQESIARAQAAGIKQIIVDPGIGFGKNLKHNLTILKQLDEFHRFGYPVLVGPSRKSFISKLLDVPVGGRLEGTAAAVAIAIMNGANIIRVHDVKEMKRVAAVVDAIIHQ